jgi:hypothetical protein
MGVVYNDLSARLSRLPLWVTGWLVFVVLPAVSLGGERLRTVESEASIDVLCGDALVLRYNKVAPKAPDEARRVYERSGYIHPLYSPQGRLVSGDFAADHPHQHGLFVAWKNTSFQGRQLDFWNHHAKTGTGTVLHDQVVSIQDDPHVAGFQVAVKHCAIDPAAGQQVILKDVWTVRVQIAEDDSLGRHYVVDFQVAQTNVTEHPLTINEYHYGGIGFRGSNAWYSDQSAKALAAVAKTPDQPLPAMEVTRHRFLTSEGKDRRLGNHSRPDWTMLYGFVDDGQVAGVRVTPLETNLRYPDPMRLHPTKPYFSISPCVAGAFDILPGETYRADYRFEIFDGAPDS